MTIKMRKVNTMKIISSFLALSSCLLMTSFFLRFIQLSKKKRRKFVKCNFVLKILCFDVAWDQLNNRQKFSLLIVWGNGGLIFLLLLASIVGLHHSLFLFIRIFCGISLFNLLLISLENSVYCKKRKGGGL